MSWPGCKPAPCYSPRMVADIVPPPFRFERVRPEAIAQWILDMPVEALAEHILNGVDLDDPPMAVVAPLFRAPLPLPPRIPVIR